MAYGFDFLGGLFGPEEEESFAEKMERDRKRREERLRLQGPLNKSNSQFDDDVVGFMKTMAPDEVKSILLRRNEANFGGKALRVEEAGQKGIQYTEAMQDDGSGDGFSDKAEDKLFAGGQPNYLQKIGNRIGMSALDMGSSMLYGTSAVVDDIVGTGAKALGAKEFGEGVIANARRKRDIVDYNKSITSAQADKAAGGGLKEIGQGYREGGILGTAGAVGLNVADQVPNLVASMTGAKVIGGLNMARNAVVGAPAATKALLGALTKGGPAAKVAGQELLRRGLTASAAASPGILPETLDTYQKGREEGAGVGRSLAVLGAQTITGGAFEAVGLDTVTAGTFSRLLGRDIAEEAAKKMLAPAAKKGVASLLTAGAKNSIKVTTSPGSFANRFGSAIRSGAAATGKGLLAAGSEGSTEFLQEGVGIASEMALGLDTPMKMKRLAEATLMGSITGGVMNGAWQSGDASLDGLAKWKANRVKKADGADTAEPGVPVVGVIDDLASQQAQEQAEQAAYDGQIAAIQLDDLDMSNGKSFVQQARQRYEQQKLASDAAVQAKLPQTVAQIASAINEDVITKLGGPGDAATYAAGKREALASMFEFATQEQIDAAVKNDQAIGPLVLGESRRQHGVMYLQKLRQMTAGKPNVPEEILRMQEGLFKYTTPPLRYGESVADPVQEKPTEAIEQELEILGQDQFDYDDGEIAISFGDTDTDGDQSMAHGDSATSPEAINRLKRVRFGMVDPGGNPVPVMNTVDAIDARTPRGYIKYSIGPNGVITIEEQNGPQTAAQTRTLTRLSSGDSGMPQGPVTDVVTRPLSAPDAQKRTAAQALILGKGIALDQQAQEKRNAIAQTAIKIAMADPTPENIEAVPEWARPRLLEALERREAGHEASVEKTTYTTGRDKQAPLDKTDEIRYKEGSDHVYHDKGTKMLVASGERIENIDRQDPKLGPSGYDGSDSGMQNASDPIVRVKVDGVEYGLRKSQALAAQKKAMVNGAHHPAVFASNIKALGKPTLSASEMVTQSLHRGRMPAKDVYNATRFGKDLVDLFKLGQEEADHIMTIVEARAGALGLSTDQYVAARISHLRVGDAKDMGHAEGWRGSVRFLGDQRAVITALKSPDVTTVLHELGHIWRREISALDPKAGETIADAVGLPRLPKSDLIARKAVPYSNITDAPVPQQSHTPWTREAEETWAQMVEAYFKNGQAPSPKLESTFQKMKDWFTEIYGVMISNERRFPKLSPEVTGVMNGLLVERAKRHAKDAGVDKITVTDPMDPETVFGQPLIATPADAWTVSPQGQKNTDNFLQSMSKSWNGFVKQLVNKQEYLTRAAKTMVDSGKFTAEYAKNMLHAAARMRTASMGAMYVIHRGTRKWTPNGYVRVGDGLAQILEGSTPQEFADISNFMNAEMNMEIVGRRHTAEAAFLADTAAWQAAQQSGQPMRKKAPERADYDPDINFEISDRKLKDLMATRGQIIARYGTGIGGLKLKIDKIRKWSEEAILDPMVEAGRISPAQKATILAKNKKYATFKYLEEVGFSPEEILQSGFGDTLPKRAAGMSESPQIDVLTAMTQKAMAVQYVVERQTVINSLTSAAFSNPDMFPGMKKIVMTPGGKPPKPVENSTVISQWVNGQKTDWAVDSDIAHALDMLDPPTANLAVKAVRGFTMFKRKMTTSTPIFALRNMIRDQFSASSNSDHGYIPFVDFYGGVYRAILGMDPSAKMDPAKQEMIDEFFRNNAGLSDIVSVDLDNQTATIDTLINNTDPHSYRGHKAAAFAASSPWSIGRLYRRTMAPLEHVSQQLEMGTRLGAYMNARKKGVSMNDAAHESRELTLDFSRKGILGGKWNRYEAFINAAIQDASKLGRNLTEKGPAGAAKFMFRSFLNFTIPALINAQLNGEDEDYKNLHEWDKSLFYHIKTPGGWFFRIPRPIGILPTVMGYGVEKMIAHMDGDPHAPGQMFNALRNAIPAGSSIPLIYRGERFEPDLGASTDLMPDFIQPLVDIRANEDSFRDGRQISPEYESEVHPTQRGGMGTTGPISERLSKMTGGVLDPYQVEYAASQYGGTMGRQIYQAADSAANKLMGGETQGMVPRNPLQVLGIVSAKPIGFSSRPVLDVMNVFRQMEMDKKTLQKHLTNGNASAHNAYVSTAEAQRSKKFLPQVTMVKGYIDGKRKIRTLLKKADMPPEKKALALTKIDQEVTQVAAQMMILLQKEAYSNPQDQSSGAAKAGIGE